jgi:hypothetical protein
MRRLLALGIATALIFSTPTAFSATPKVGGSCTKINQFYELKSTLLVCAVTKSKKTWRKATSLENSFYKKIIAERISKNDENVFESPVKVAIEEVNANLGTSCFSGINCKIGNTGPGGGIIFFDAGKKQSWGRYLELAPNGWSGTPSDPSAPWCNETELFLTSGITSPTLKVMVGAEIGKGKANTDLMTTYCTWGAAVISRAYKGGAKSDWYLPSAGELNEICKFAHFQITGDPKVVCAESRVRRSGFESYWYWSSYETEPQFASLQNFTLGEPSGGGAKKALCRVRPVRAF